MKTNEAIKILKENNAKLECIHHKLVEKLWEVEFKIIKNNEKIKNMGEKPPENWNRNWPGEFDRICDEFM